MSSTAQDTGVKPSDFTEFDFVIIGGGLSGLVLAARLSENPNVSVGVIESGLWRPNDPKINTPYRMFEMLADPAYQFGSLTVPQKHIGDRELFLPRGRVLGGGSSVNFLVWHRGSKTEYDSFEKLGNPGWNFETIARAGRKSETFHAPDTDAQLAVASWNEASHGREGPVQTSFSGWIPESHKAFFEVMEKFGLAVNADRHGGINTGIHTSASSIDPKYGTRSSSASAYYAPNASRPNLSVLCGAHATKVELERKGDLQVAVGVNFVVDGKSYFVKARKEVILSAGAIQSPQLLELSGIGSPSVLEPLGINVKINNPNVGENLQDHMMTFMTYMTKPGHHTQDVVEDPILAKEVAAAYEGVSKTQYRGPLGGGCAALLYVPLHTFIPENELAQMKRKLADEKLPKAAKEGIQLQLDSLEDREKGTMEWAYLPRKFPSPTPAEPGRSYISLLVALQHPFSRGHTHIKSSDAQAEPEVDPHYLENSWDKRLLVHSLQTLDKASKTEPLASFLERRVDPAPGDDSIEVFEKYLHDTIGPGIHWIGTASMLPKEKGGVVDPRCKVYGTTNLRVVDASIVPLHVSAHIQATLYAFAERAAEIIIEDN